MSLTEQPQDAQVADDSDVLEDAQSAAERSKQPDKQLAGWIMSKVTRWRMLRVNNYGKEWDQYYRIWRGKWDPSLKGKQAERSRIITPATQSAVDQTVAEMAEAVFGRGMWVDLAPPAEQDNDAVLAELETTRDNLIDDLQDSRFPADAIEAFYNGAVYGTGIAKRTIETRLDGKRYVCWEPVMPSGFVIDSAATTVDEALGVAHETIRPLHEIKEKQQSGEYLEAEIGNAASGFGVTDLMKGGLTDFLEIDPQDGVYITEWHGKVPAKWLGSSAVQQDDLDLKVDEVTEGDPVDEELVEAVVIIANAEHILSAEKNELNDRGFVAYQHHRSPNSFFGIGVVEKAFNAQAGLDGEVRARQDALALTTYPTVGVDATRMPRNLSMVVGPGKVYLTNGRPSEVIEPLTFGNLNNASFQQSGDMERYVQIATGATDPAKPVNEKNSTASGMSQQSSAYIKRAKLTMQSVDTDFLAPLVRKTIIAYNQLDPKRYPALPKFTVNSSMSIMAREFEQMQMTNLLAIIPQESPAFPIILKGIIQNYSGPQKDQIIEAIDKSMQPDPAQVQAQQATQAATIQKLQKENQKLDAEIAEITSRAGLNGAKAQGEQVKAKLAPVQTQISSQQAANAAESTKIQNRQLEVEAAKVQIDHHHKTLGHIHERVKNAIALKKASQPAPAPGGA